MFLPSRREFLHAVAVALASSAASPVHAATLSRFPYVQNIGRTRATVRWTTGYSGAGAIEFRSSAEQEHKTVTAEVREYLPADTGMAHPYYRYETALSELTPGTEYVYSVLMNGREVVKGPLRFRTPGTQPFQFLAFGDSGTGSKEQGTVAGQLLKHGAKLVLHTGDLVYPTGTHARYESLYFDYYRDLMKEIPFFPCPGNHDYYEFKCIPYRAMHALPDETVSAADSGRYYSFDWGNVHFVSLDSNDSLEEAARGGGGMLAWLDQDLEKTDKFWRIVYVHHPAYSSGNHRDEREAQLVRKYIVPILDKHSVPIVLNGHEHSYQRSTPMKAGQIVQPGKGTVYVTTGGGGADLHPVSPADYIAVGVSQHHYVTCDVNGGRLQMAALGLRGEALDKLTVAPMPLIRENSVVNAASFSSSVACGGLVSIFGLQFCPEEITPTRYPLPLSAAGTSVLLNGEPLPILMASATQINVQLPFDAVGAAEVVVRTPNGSDTQAVSIQPTAPAIFSDAVFHVNGLQVSEETPAFEGAEVTIYLTGLGAVIGGARAGEAASALRTKAVVKIQIANKTITPEYAGLAERLAGVNIVRFVVPAGLSGRRPLVVTADGVASNIVLLSVR